MEKGKWRQEKRKRGKIVKVRRKENGEAVDLEGMDKGKGRTW